MSETALIDTPAPVSDAPPPAAVDGEAAGAGADGKAAAAEAPTYWPKDWQDRLAKEFGGEDPKAVEKERKRIERLGDPAKIYGKARELEAKLSGGGLVKLPGKDAKPEDMAAFRKALGVPDTAEGYFTDLKLEGNKVLGDADKPIAASFASALHEVGAPPAVVAKSLDWYFKHLEEVSAAEVAADEAFRDENMASLREDWGSSFKRNINVIDTLFTDAPELKDLILGGRTADGKKFGDDARVIRALSKWAGDLNPAATVTLPAGGSMTDRLAEIKKFKTENPDAYDADHKMQAEERELIDARLKMQGRGK